MGDFLKKAYNEQQQKERAKTISKQKRTTMIETKSICRYALEQIESITKGNK